MKKTIRGITAIFLKDLHSELQTRYALNTVLAFVGASLLLILFALQPSELTNKARAGLIWIVILFAALSSLSRSFINETEHQTFSLLRLHSNAAGVFGGKLIYNFVFTLITNITAFILYLILLDLAVQSLLGLFLVILLGSLALSGISTFLAAIVSQADRKGAIFSVISIPLLFPIILVLVDATKTAIFKGMNSNLLDNLIAAGGYAGATITAGFLLFEYIWIE